MARAPGPPGPSGSGPSGSDPSGPGASASASASASVPSSAASSAPSVPASLPRSALRLLRDALGRAGLPAGDEEFLDALWLARVVPSGPAAPLATALAGRDEALSPPAGTTADGEERDGAGTAAAGADTGMAAGEEPDAAAPAGGDGPVPAVGTVPLHGGPSAEGNGKRPAAWTPGSRALRQELRLGRALRPLKRRIPSDRDTELDEAATVTAQADTGIPRLVLRPRPERWLRLAFVVDSGTPMLLWERHVAELRALFERSGAFRQIDVCSLRYPVSGRGAVRLGRPWDDEDGSPSRPADALADPSGRTMVLVLTDGAGAPWRDGRLRPVLESWARRGPTAVLHVLPRRLWAGSGVAAETWDVLSPRPGAPNAAWRVRHPVLPPPVAVFRGVPVPVLALSPGGLASWAAATTLVGRPVPVRLWTERHTGNAARTAGSGREAGLAEFSRAASPEALRLAAHLAAMAPLTVPAMRLVHGGLFEGPGSGGAVPLAEVLLGGLLRPVPPPAGLATGGPAGGGPAGGGGERHQLFDFTDEARRVLLEAVPTADLVEVGHRVGARMAELLGRSADFPAWPAAGGASPAAAEDGPFPFARLPRALSARLGLLPPAPPPSSPRAGPSGKPPAGASGEPSAEPQPDGPQATEDAELTTALAGVARPVRDAFRALWPEAWRRLTDSSGGEAAAREIARYLLRLLMFMHEPPGGRLGRPTLSAVQELLSRYLTAQDERSGEDGGEDDAAPEAVDRSGGHALQPDMLLHTAHADIAVEAKRLERRLSWGRDQRPHALHELSPGTGAAAGKGPGPSWEDLVGDDSSWTLLPVPGRARVSILMGLDRFLPESAPLDQRVRLFAPSRGGPAADLVVGCLLPGQAPPPAAPPPAAPGAGARPYGEPVENLNDPFAFGVRPAMPIPPGAPAGSWPALPQYMRRAHDLHLDEALTHTLTTGQSRLVLLAGKAGEGRTRAFWEALRLLPPGWRLWQPPRTRSAGELRELREALPLLAPRTVLWLDAWPQPGGETERFAEELHALLSDASRGPLLVLGTPPQGDRVLLARREGPGGARALVADQGLTLHLLALTSSPSREELNRAAAADPRIAFAAKRAGPEQIVPYLAAAPELVRRYEEAPSEARALLDLFADVARLGHEPVLTEAQTVTGLALYLSRTHEEVTFPGALRSQLASALEYATDGGGEELAAPLVRAPGSPDAETAYRLADYLAQTLPSSRGTAEPPLSRLGELLELTEDLAGPSAGRDPEREQAPGREREPEPRWLFACLAVVSGDEAARAAWPALSEQVRALASALAEAVAAGSGEADRALWGQGDSVLLAVPVADAGASSLVADCIDTLLRARSGEMRLGLPHPAVLAVLDIGPPPRDAHLGIAGEAVHHVTALADAAVLELGPERLGRGTLAVAVSERMMAETAGDSPDPRFRGLERIELGTDRRTRRERAWLGVFGGRARWHPALPHAAASRAVLVGASRYAHLPDLPDTSPTLAALADALTHETRGGFSRERTEVITDPDSPHHVLDAVHRAGAEAEDTLLLYFSGHALSRPRGAERLMLALGGTRPSGLGGLEYRDLLHAVSLSRARRKVVLLDCCSTGDARAVQRRAEQETLRERRSGFRLLTHVAPGTREYTDAAGRSVFTSALVAFLNHGVRGGPEVLDLLVLVRALEEQLAALGDRRGDRITLGGRYPDPPGEPFALAANAAYRSPPGDG